MSLRKNTEQIINSLKQQNHSFKSFKMISSGEFDIDDADWNYKDLYHAKFVHNDLSPSIFSMDDYQIVQTITQKILFFNITYMMVQYDSGPQHLTYVSSITPFFIIINTEFIKKSKLITDVITTYNIGSSKLLLTIFFPFIKWSITKNYNKLMVGDMGMRLRKGYLRKLGVSFIKKKERYTFTETLNLNQKNCVYKISIFNSSRSSKVLITKKNGPIVKEFLTGTSDPWGLRGVISNNKLSLYPRMCDHEGACLDNVIPIKNIVSCPWHGKKIKPINENSIIENNKFNLSYNKKNYRFNFNNNSIKLTVT